MEIKESDQIVENQFVIEEYPIVYRKQQNIYVLKENSFANKLIELSLGDKAKLQQSQSYYWYLYPEEMLYLVSVYEGKHNQKQSENEMIRKNLIKKIYKNMRQKDINSSHLYLNIRKRNKFIRRINLKTLQNKIENSYQFEKQISLYKIYELSEDYKQDRDYKYYLITNPQQKIHEVLYSNGLKQIKKKLNIQTLHVCIFENNDFIVIQVNQY